MISAKQLKREQKHHTKREVQKMVQAMKRGAKATLTGRSSRGTKTEDTFSLKGFTAAVEDASKRCK